VGDLLKDQVLESVKPEEPLDEVFRRMATGFFHHLPVVSEKGELVGVISDRFVNRREERRKKGEPCETDRFGFCNFLRDIRTAADSPILHDVENVVKKLHKIHVKQAMTTSVVTVNDDAPIVEAAKV